MRRVVAVFVLLLATFFGVPASASPTPPPVAAAPGDPLCSLEEWRSRGLDECISRLQEVSAARVQCLRAPEPGAPDSGFGGWFAAKPTWETGGGGNSYLLYSKYGYAGYDYTTYDIGCADTLMHPDYKIESTIANGEFMIATGIVAASNALREKAWDPGELWSWADPLVKGATQAIYERVFSVFGVLTLAIVGVYLLWRSRQAQMSAALTTAGWALMVLIAVTALAQWPIKAASVADSTLVATLGVVHQTINKAHDPGPCDDAPENCVDKRPPAVRAGDTAVSKLLYDNWLRGALGSSTSPTAIKYGPALYRAKSLSWREIEMIQDDPARRQGIIDAKKREWMKVGEQIRAEDPEAYEYLKGTKGMERVGAGFVAILASFAYATFDIVASLLVLLGFLVIRWAVVAAPALGTIGLLRPASAGLRRLVNAVIAAAINVAMFGTGAAVYLFAVDLIMSTATLPGWLQVTLVMLCGVVGWILLRPYTRVVQLTGRSSGAALLTARPQAATTTTTPVAVGVTHDGQRNEGRVEVEIKDERTSTLQRAEASPAADIARQQRGWSNADVPQQESTYAIYRPASVPHQAAPPTVGGGAPAQSQGPARTEARAESR